MKLRVVLCIANSLIGNVKNKKVMFKGVRSFKLYMKLKVVNRNWGIELRSEKKQLCLPGVSIWFAFYFIYFNEYNA